MDAGSIAKTTRLDSGFSMSGSELSLWEVTLIWRRLMKAEWPSGTETGLITAPYSFEPSDT